MFKYLLYIYSKLLKKIQISSIVRSNIHKTSKICSQSHLVNVYLDRYSYIGNNCQIIYANIGRFCSISDNVIIGGASHPINWVSSSPLFHIGNNVLKKNFSDAEYFPYENTVIGNDVWIGNGAMIKSGLNIGHGAVIGMGAVVTKNVGPYEIWAGNPAKLIRKRFDEETIIKLLASEWWLSSDKELLRMAKHFEKPSHFIDYEECK